MHIHTRNIYIRAHIQAHTYTHTQTHTHSHTLYSDNRVDSKPTLMDMLPRRVVEKYEANRLCVAELM